VNKDLKFSETLPRCIRRQDHLLKGWLNSPRRLSLPHHHKYQERIQTNLPSPLNHSLFKLRDPCSRPPKMCGDLTIRYEECDHSHHQPEKFTCQFSNCGFQHLPSGSKLLPKALHTEKGKCPDCLVGKPVPPATPPKKPASRRAFRGRGKSGYSGCGET
jgi:hypothetical protein